MPPKSSDGWSLMQMNHPDVALSGMPRAIEITPSLCSSPVTLVRSSAIGGKPDFALSGLTPAWITSIFTVLSGYLYIWFLRHVTAQAIGILAYIEPVSGALLAWALLDEALTWPVVVGGALVIAAGAAVVLLEPADAAALGSGA